MTFAPVSSLSALHRVPRCRRGLSWLPVVASLAVVSAGGLVGVVYYPWEEEAQAAFEHVVQKGDFIHKITEKGLLESSKNIEVRCEVQSREGTKIKKLMVAEGARVKKDDVLALLESSELVKEKQQQEIVVKNAEAARVQGDNLLETAKFARREYEQGTFVQEEQVILSEVLVAEENLRRAEEYAKYTQQLAKKGFATGSQVEADQFAVKKADKELTTARIKLGVLRDITKAKQITMLDNDIKIYAAQLEAATKTHELEELKLQQIVDQIAKCKVIAPAAGEVVYANDRDSRRSSDQLDIEEGAVVNEQQVMFRLPNSTMMRMKAKVSESRIGLVKVGQVAEIRCDAHWDKVMYGTVSRVDSYPIATRWSASNVKEYYTYIEIPEPPPGLRPGMTAKATITIREQGGVLLAPVSAVYESGGAHYCLVKQEDGEPVEKKVEAGFSDDNMIVINSGLEESDVIVMNPRKYVKIEAPRTARRRGGGPGGGTPKRKTSGAAGKTAAQKSKPPTSKSPAKSQD